MFVFGKKTKVKCKWNNIPSIYPRYYSARTFDISSSSQSKRNRYEIVERQTWHKDERDQWFQSSALIEWEMSEVHFETPMQALLKFKSIFSKEHLAIQERRMAYDEPDQQRQSYQGKKISIVNSRIAVRI